MFRFAYYPNLALTLKLKIYNTNHFFAK
jgi:hypothetical protein